MLTKVKHNEENLLLKEAVVFFTNNLILVLVSEPNGILELVDNLLTINFNVMHQVFFPGVKARTALLLYRLINNILFYLFTANFIGSAAKTAKTCCNESPLLNRCCLWHAPLQCQYRKHYSCQLTT